MSEYPEYFKTGTVFNTNPKLLTCDLIKTEGGMLYNVPIANTTGGIFTNDVSWKSNLRGAVVFYTYMDGCPYILGTLPQRVKVSDKISTNIAETGTGGDNDTTYGKANAASYAAGRETDYQPNDKVISSDGGSKIALLGEGGVALKASPLSQIIMGAGMDFIRMVCRQLEIFTDFGSLCFSHGSSGRTGLTIKGGAAYGEEAQPGSGVHTVFMHLGDTENAPETRFGVRVTDTEGGEFGALALGKDGRLFFTTSKDSLTMIGKDDHKLVDGDTYTELRGNRTELVGKNQKTDITGKEERTIVQNRSIIIGKEEKYNVGEDMMLTVGGTLHIGCDGLVLDSAHGTSGAEVLASCGNATMRCNSLNILKA